MKMAQKLSMDSSTDYLDQIPQENVCLEIGDYRIEILNIDENSIEKVKIKKKES